MYSTRYYNAYQPYLQHRSLEVADIYAMDGYAPGTSSYLQPAGTTDFPVYPTTSSYGQQPHQPPPPPPMHGLPPHGAAGTSGRFAQPATSAFGMTPFTSAPTSQPLNVTTTGLTGYGAGPLSGPGAYGGAGFSAAPSQGGWPSTSVPAMGSGGGTGAAGTTISATQFNRDPYSMPVPTLQREYDMLRREYEAAVQKLNSTMNSIKTFWSPELKRERAMRKDEMQKMQMMQDQLRMASQDNQKSATTLRQLQTELQCQYDLQQTIRTSDMSGIPREEFDALRMERDRVVRELQLTKDTARELQMQIETQRQTLQGRDESIRKLLDMLQAKGMVPYGAGQEHMELEQSRSKIIELENRCRHLETTIGLKEQDIRTLQDECLSASDKLRQSQRQNEWLHKLGGSGQYDEQAMQGLLDTKESRIQQLERQLQHYEEELRSLREQLQNQPRNFTDKSVSTSEYQEVKLKMEKAELELQTKVSELQAAQTRLMTVEDQLRDIKKHHIILKESCNAKEHQLQLMQGDIEALRAKLEQKNETIEQKQQQMAAYHSDQAKSASEISDIKEQMKIKDNKVQMFQRKVEGLEELVREKDSQIDDLKQRLNNLPAMQHQKQMQEQVEEMIRERDRMQREIREQRDVMEQERVEQLEQHRGDTKDLRAAIDSLQKEIRDRQVLIESQNEKISDMNRELTKLRREHHGRDKRLDGDELSSSEKNEIDRLTDELDEARGEVDKLLRMVKQHEREENHLHQKLKEAQRQLEEARRTGKFSGAHGDTLGTSPLYRKAADEHVLKQKDQRIEELEEALRESVSITAERELAIAQQKQVAQQMDMRMNAYKDQLTALQQNYSDVTQRAAHVDSTGQDKDAIIRALRRERHKLLDDYLQLKQDYFQALINEKEARVALLEMTNRNPEEVHNLKRQREKLMRRMKDENERRIRLLADSKTELGDVGSLMKEMKSPLDQDDDAEGIWA